MWKVGWIWEELGAREWDDENKVYENHKELVTVILKVCDRGHGPSDSLSFPVSTECPVTLSYVPYKELRLC